MADLAYGRVADAAPRTEASKQTRRFSVPKPLLGWLLPALIALAWEGACRGGLVPPNLLPAPSAIALTLYRLAANGDLWLHLGATCYRLVFGFVLGTALGTLFGAATARRRWHAACSTR